MSCARFWSSPTVASKLDRYGGWSGSDDSLVEGGILVSVLSICIIGAEDVLSGKLTLTWIGSDFDWIKLFNSWVGFDGCSIKSSSSSSSCWGSGIVSSFGTIFVFDLLVFSLFWINKMISY